MRPGEAIAEDFRRIGVAANFVGYVIHRREEKL
jgi:hypothetical protein